MEKWTKKELNSFHNKFKEMDLAKTETEYGKAMEALDKKCREYNQETQFSNFTFDGINKNEII
jgi:DUF2075 family protein